jgi:hypothetical protein
MFSHTLRMERSPFGIRVVPQSPGISILPPFKNSRGFEAVIRTLHHTLPSGERQVHQRAA